MLSAVVYVQLHLEMLSSGQMDLSSALFMCELKKGARLSSNSHADRLHSLRMSIEIADDSAPNVDLGIPSI